MKAKFLTIFSVCALLMFTRCEEDETYSIVGTWSATKAEFEIEIAGIPIPIEFTEDDPSVEVVFREDGTVSITDDTGTTNGTYSVDGKDLDTDLDFNTDFTSLEGEFKIKKLTQSTLILTSEQTGSGEDPETGDVLEGTFRTEITFSRL